MYTNNRPPVIVEYGFIIHSLLGPANSATGISIAGASSSYRLLLVCHISTCYIFALHSMLPVGIAHASLLHHEDSEFHRNGVYCRRLGLMFLEV